MLERMRRKESPLALLVGMWTGAATLENCVEVPQRVKNRPALRPSNCTVGDLPQRHRCNETPGHLHPDLFIAAMSTIAKLWKEPRCPSKDEWIKKMWFMYTMEYYSAIRNDKYPPSICFDVDGSGGYYAEWNKSIGEGHISYGLIHLGNIKNSERE